MNMSILIEPLNILPDFLYNKVPHFYFIFGMLYIATGLIPCMIAGSIGIAHSLGICAARRGMI